MAAVVVVVVVAGSVCHVVKLLRKRPAQDAFGAVEVVAADDAWLSLLLLLPLAVLLLLLLSAESAGLWPDAAVARMLGLGLR